MLARPLPHAKDARCDPFGIEVGPVRAALYRAKKPKCSAF